MHSFNIYLSDFIRGNGIVSQPTINPRPAGVWLATRPAGGGGAP